MRISQTELDEIYRAMKSEKKTRIYKRYHSLYLYHSGKTCKEISQILGFTEKTVSTLNQTYYKEGLKGIPDKPRTGRPKRLTEVQESELRDTILNKLPQDVGFPSDFNWTADIIAKYIKLKYQYDYSIKGITLILKRLGLSYTRPTYVLAKADKEKQEQFKQEFEELKKTIK
jgi:putative transposase